MKHCISTDTPSEIHVASDTAYGELESHSCITRHQQLTVFIRLHRDRFVYGSDRKTEQARPCAADLPFLACSHCTHLNPILLFCAAYEPLACPTRSALPPGLSQFDSDDIVQTEMRRDGPRHRMSKSRLLQCQSNIAPYSGFKRVD